MPKNKEGSRRKAHQEDPEASSSISAPAHDEDLDISELTRIRGAHRGAFRRLEHKVDALAVSPIARDAEVYDAEALLTTIKGKAAVIRRWDAEIELKIEDDLLDDELEAATQWEHKMGVTEARLCALLDNFKRIRTDPRNSSGPGQDPSGTANQMKLPKLSLITFTGPYTDWMSFAELFKAAVDFNPLKLN